MCDRNPKAKSDSPGGEKTDLLDQDHLSIKTGATITANFASNCVGSRLSLARELLLSNDNNRH